MNSHRKACFLRFTFLAASLLVLSTIGFGQLNTFDGKSIELIAPDAGGRCVAGFGGNPTVKRLPGNTSSINVEDCSGNFLGTITDTSGWTIARDMNTGFWCFRTGDSKVKVSYTVGSNNYSWTWLSNTSTTGFHNIKDFGALGNGHKADGTVNTSADDTQAIKNAITFVAAKLGGTLIFPEGVYRVSSTLVLPSGIILKGTSGMSTGASQTYFTGAYRRSNSTIALVGENKSLFRIGECVDGVKMENLSLKAESSVNTNGVEAVGFFTTASSSQEFDFENVAFDSFDKGLYFHAVDGNKLWQIDFVKVDHCMFNSNKTAGILIDSFNSDWIISSSLFYLPVTVIGQNTIRGDAVIIDRATTVQMNNSFGGGIDYSDTGRGGAFIRALYVGGLTVINSAAERLSETISYGKDRETQIIWGSYSNTLTLINNGFSDPLNVWGRVNFVSTGNGYAGKTVNLGAGVRAYSTGDRFCMDLNGNFDPASPCGKDSNGVAFPLNEAGFQGPGTIVFQSGQPTEQNPSAQQIASIPAKMKGDLEIKGNEREADVNAVANSRPILSVTVENDGLPFKPLIRLGHNPYVYNIERDTRGWLKFSGTQEQPYRGFFFSGAPFQMPSFTWAEISSSAFSLSQPGTTVYCSNCQSNTSPCQTGGNGTLAVANGLLQWDCK